MQSRPHPCDALPISLPFREAAISRPCPFPKKVVILSHAGVELARVTLPPGEYIIGRSRKADIRADTPLLSRKHARLSAECRWRNSIAMKRRSKTCARCSKCQSCATY